MKHFDKLPKADERDTQTQARLWREAREGSQS
jgi:hypothetical protein